MVKYFTVANGTANLGETELQPKLIQGFIDQVVSKRGNADQQLDQKQLATDDVLCMIGTWLCMDSYFRKKTGQRPIERVGAGVENPKPLVNCTLRELLNRCPAVPKVGGHPLSMNADPPNGTPTAQPAHGGTGEDAGEAPNPAHDGPATGENGGVAPTTAQVDECAFEPFLDLEDESMRIEAKKLNICTLKMYAQVDIHWTKNMARHLLITRWAGRTTVEIFSLPSALAVPFPPGVDRAFVDEVKASYASLFYPDAESFKISPNTDQHVDEAGHDYAHLISSPHCGPLSRLCGRRFWCTCWNCQYHKTAVGALESLKKSMGCHHPQTIPHQDLFDTEMLHDISRDAEDWTPEGFPVLWERIVALQGLQAKARPRSLLALFRDRRDTVQWWGMM
ncbi:hypothetical protein ACJ41O_006701 [Fusarium nematophilum]